MEIRDFLSIYSAYVPFSNFHRNVGSQNSLQKFKATSLANTVQCLSQAVPANAGCQEFSFYYLMGNLHIKKNPKNIIGFNMVACVSVLALFLLVYH